VEHENSVPGQGTPSRGEEKTPLRYEEKTADTYSAMVEHFTPTETQGTLFLRGHCPRCDAIIDIPVVTSIFRSSRSIGGWKRRQAPRENQAGYEEPMMCTCQEEHPDRPEGRTGCGAYWVLTITPPAQ